MATSALISRFARNQKTDALMWLIKEQVSHYQVVYLKFMEVKVMYS